MSHPSIDPHETLPVVPVTPGPDLPASDRRLAEAEMERVLGTTPFRMALDASGAGIAHWKHDPLHDLVEPMSHHVIMAYNGVTQHTERRTGRSVVSGTFRPVSYPVVSSSVQHVNLKRVVS